MPGIEDGHNKLWRKTKKAFKYIWEHYQDDAEWFFRADDDAYVLTDNLRTFLKKYDPKQPHYLGCRVDYGNNVIVNLGFSELANFYCQLILLIIKVKSIQVLQ